MKDMTLRSTETGRVSDAVVRESTAAISGAPSLNRETVASITSLLQNGPHETCCRELQTQVGQLERRLPPDDHLILECASSVDIRYPTTRTKWLSTVRASESVLAKHAAVLDHSQHQAKRILWAASENLNDRIGSLYPVAEWHTALVNVLAHDRNGHRDGQSEAGGDDFVLELKEVWLQPAESAESFVSRMKHVQAPRREDPKESQTVHPRDGFADVPKKARAAKNEYSRDWTKRVMGELNLPYDESALDRTARGRPWDRQILDACDIVRSFYALRPLHHVITIQNIFCHFRINPTSCRPLYGHDQTNAVRRMVIRQVP